MGLGFASKLILWACDVYGMGAAAALLQSCPTLCDPIDGSPPGSCIPGILQAGTLEWVAISFSNAWKWKVKVKSLSLVWLFVTPWTAAYQAPPGKNIGVGFHCLLWWDGRDGWNEIGHELMTFESRKWSSPSLPFAFDIFDKMKHGIDIKKEAENWVIFRKNHHSTIWMCSKGVNS